MKRLIVSVIVILSLLTMTFVLARQNYGYKLIGDFNHDCVVDDKDFEMFKVLYVSENGDGVYQGWGDLNKDGKIDRIDFAIFANNYGKTC